MSTSPRHSTGWTADARQTDILAFMLRLLPSRGKRRTTEGNQS